MAHEATFTRNVQPLAAPRIVARQVSAVEVAEVQEYCRERGYWVERITETGAVIAGPGGRNVPDESSPRYGQPGIMRATFPIFNGDVIFTGYPTDLQYVYLNEESDFCCTDMYELFV